MDEQLVLIQGVQSRKRQAAEVALIRLRKIHEELNSIYGSHPSQRPSIHTPADTAELLAPFMDHLDHEELWVILLDIKNRVKKLVKLYQGTISSSNVRVAEVFHEAVIENAPQIIVVHNHPSGDPVPSPEDVQVTRSIVQAGKLLEITVLDHIVIGAQGRWMSLRERGLGFGFA